jgi:hypothetical protein
MGESNRVVVGWAVGSHKLAVVRQPSGCTTPLYPAPVTFPSHSKTQNENLAKITASIGSAAPGSFQLVECGAFSRRKPPVQS